MKRDKWAYLFACIDCLHAYTYIAKYRHFESGILKIAVMWDYLSYSGDAKCIMYLRSIR